MRSIKKNTTLNSSLSNYYFWLFILLHTLLWTLGPALCRESIPHDTLEGITWGLQWQLGYYKHPFLTAWLSAAVTQVLGIGWPVYLLAQCAVSLTFIAVWLLAKKFLSQQQALIAVLLMEGILFYNINSFNFTPDTLQSPLWAWLILTFYNAINTQKTRYWLACGWLAALCVCTKYQVVVLLLPMILFCVLNTKARKSFKTAGFYWGALCFFVVILPHLFWLYQHQFITLLYAQNVSAEYTQNKNLISHIVNPLRFFVSYLLNIFLIFLLVWPFYNRLKKPLPLKSLQWQFLIIVGLGPQILSLVLCALSGDYFPPRWSTPYFPLTGILVLSYLNPQFTAQRVQQFAYTFVLFSCLLFIARISTFTLFPRPASDAFLPNQKIANHLSKLWQDRYHRSLPYLAGSSYLVTSVLPYMQDKPVPYLNWAKKTSPWIDEAKLIQQGGLFIWDKGRNYTWDAGSMAHATLPDYLFSRYTNLIIIESSFFYRLSDNQPIEIGIAILAPRDKFSHQWL